MLVFPSRTRLGNLFQVLYPTFDVVFRNGILAKCMFYFPIIIENGMTLSISNPTTSYWYAPTAGANGSKNPSLIISQSNSFSLTRLSLLTDLDQTTESPFSSETSYIIVSNFTNQLSTMVGGCSSLWRGSGLPGRERNDAIKTVAILNVHSSTFSLSGK